MNVRAIGLAGTALIASAALAQFPPAVSGMGPAPAVTPMQWKHEWLKEPNTSWDYVRLSGSPLVVSLPGAPSDGPSGFDRYMWRLFHDEGYALGQLVWHDDRAKTQPVRDDIEQVRAQLAEVRGEPAKFGGFDPSRIVIASWGDDAFPAALIAFDSGPRASSPICAAIFIEAMNLDPASPETPTATRKFSEDSNAAQLSPARFAASAPPTLLMTEVFDRSAGRRADALAEAIRSAGGVAVRATFSRFVDSDPRTYLGYSEDPSTNVIQTFLRTYCPAQDSPQPQPQPQP
jgi:hypothetical protein